MPAPRSPTVLFCLLSTAALVAQEGGQLPSFKTGVQLVRIDVTVLDDQRQPVGGLQLSDFTVLEDGQPRPVRAFRFVDHAAGVAIPAATATTSVPDVVSNRTGDDTSRLLFILLDRSIPPERPMIVARQIADAAVDAMAPGDLAAIVTTGGGVPQNLTSDRARLHKTIAASDWSQQLSRAQTDDPIIAGMGLANPLDNGGCLCGLCVMDTIARIANEVRDVPRRKVLLFVGSNIIVQVGPRPGTTDVLACDKLVHDSRERLFDALGTSGLTVHSIDPQGLANVGPATRASVPNGIVNRDGSVLNGQLTQEMMEFMAGQGNLDVLPELTGGRTVLNTNQPFRAVPDVLHESDAYYLLGFEPLEARGDVRHSIQVKVARKGVSVHTQRFISPAPATAVAASPAPTSPLDRALTDLLPNASLPLRMAIATFAGLDPRHAYVGVTLDASSFAAGGGAVPLEIALLASDERGRRVGGARQTGTVQVPPAAGGGSMAAFVELQTYLALPPGEYELRAAVMNPATRAASSVFTHITVPSFDGAGLALSDVVLGTRDNAGALPDGAPAIPIVPTTTRAFGSTERAWAFVQVYRRSTDATPVSIDASVVDNDGRRISRQSLREVSFAGRQADVRLGLPLKTLIAGRYILQVDAKQGRAEVSRSIAFSVAQAQPSFTQEHSPELDAALTAAAGYIEQYEQRISAIGAEEQYEQAMTGTLAQPGEGSVFRPALGNRTGGVATRKTRANIMTISLGTRGWVSFRDVFELDGRPVRDRDERLSRILQNVTPDSLEQARQIAAESARYNLEPEAVDRTINVPMTALLYLRAANQGRLAFRLGKSERIAGVNCTVLQFSEQGRPRLIRTSDDAPANGTVWIDMAGGGRILKTELRIESAGAPRQIVRMRTAVTYAKVDKLDLWVPAVMDETYELSATRQILTGHATYSDFREFKVTTSQDIK